MQKLEDDLGQAQDDIKFLEQQLHERTPVKISGYVDAGLFATNGNGAGTRSDVGGTYFPQYKGVVPGSWVFWGDPLATMVNSRGDVADTGESRAITFDPIDSQGNSTFLVNAVNLALFSGITDTASVQTSVDLLPRKRVIGDSAGQFLGDFIDIKLAYGEWKPRIGDGDDVQLALQAGKFDSVVGYEYRMLESPDRMGVTPSLVCRYVCGRPIGLKARAIVKGAFIANVAVTNGSQFSESFSFHDETDTNQFKSLAGRVSYKREAFEVGASGSFGAQDLQASSSIYQWHAGADVHVDWKDIDFTAEYVQGKAPGETSPGEPACDLAPCLTYKAAYGLVGYRLTNTFTPYARVDWRDALHRNGASFVYISELVRATVGLRAEIGTRVIVKAEGTLAHELAGLQFPDDVVTTSLVIKY